MKNKTYYDIDTDTGLGGFSLNNIRNWVIEEAELSGDFESFIYNLSDVLEDLIEEIEMPDYDYDNDYFDG